MEPRFISTMKTLRTLLVLAIGYAAGVAAPALADGLEATVTPKWSRTSPDSFRAILNADKGTEQPSNLVIAEVGASAPLADGSNPRRTTYTIKAGDAACTFATYNGNAVGMTFVPGPTVADIYMMAAVAGSPVQDMQVIRVQDNRVPSMPAGVAR